MNNQKPNRLIHSTSPYLLQHAYNPVDWFPWGKEALTKAMQEDKPILVSIGYSSCHWCHVMERESFENQDVADIMNEFFVCIKVDREERPDVDHLYMDAIQAMGKSGGWPLNVFLTPDQKPFFGGTYFQPQVWAQVLTNIHKAYINKREDIHESANGLAEHLAKQGIQQFKQQAIEEESSAMVNHMYNQLEKEFDYTWGGLDKTPKFIMPSVWLWLLRYAHLSKNTKALEHTLFTLKKIAKGGIYDQVGGGFARYSVDGKWFAPHFEKMLYDNAQLLTLYSEAYSISKDLYFKKIVEETYSWLTREMMSEEGGYYSALDADSEGVEGKFYVWTYEELMAVLGNSGKLVCEYYGVTIEGNWEHGTNILIESENTDWILDAYKINQDQLESRIQDARHALLLARNKRIRPGLDDKVVTGWNAMTIIGLIDSYHALGDTRFLDTALKNARFLQQKLMQENIIYRSYKGTRSNIEGFLEDYAYIIQAWIKLYQATFDETWIQQAEKLTCYVMDSFYDQEDSYFYYASSQSEKLIANKKEIFDNVIPSSNSLMAQNLLHLGTILDKDDWRTIGEKMAEDLSYLIMNEPNYMSHWGIVLTELKQGLAEVAFTGKECISLKDEFKKHYQPFCLVMGAVTNSVLPLLQGKTQADASMIYVCYNKTCKLPVSQVAHALSQLKN